MELINDIKMLKAFVENNEFCLLYIQAPDCGLCSIMLEKIENVVNLYANLHAVRAEIHVVPEIAGAFLVATAPTVLVFLNGKEKFLLNRFE